MSNVDLLCHQYDYLTCTDKNCVLLGGIGSGKSYVNGAFIVDMITRYPKAEGLIVAPTYGQLIKATVNVITNFLDSIGIEYHLVKSGADKSLTIGNTKIHLFSADQPDNCRGIEVGWIIFDELAYMSEYAYKVFSGRLRQPNSPLLKRGTTSPNSFNWLYDDESFKRIHARTKDNMFLADEYYQDLVELYGGEDSPLAQQELFGKFVNLQAGAIYWA